MSDADAAIRRARYVFAAVIGLATAAGFAAAIFHGSRTVLHIIAGNIRVEPFAMLVSFGVFWAAFFTAIYVGQSLGVFVGTNLKDALTGCSSK